MTTQINEIISNIINNIIRAYQFIQDIGISIPAEKLRNILKEVEHIAIHELAHEIIRSIYPETRDYYKSNPILGECIDEVGARMLELYISKRIGTYTHTFDEHVYELKHYTNLQEISIDVRDLEEMYRETEKQIDEKKLKEAIDIVIKRCIEWVPKKRNS
jgi:hypothetical protein